MKERSIDVLCMQETRVKHSPYYTVGAGFLVVLSGSAADGREFAGVGFIIAPWVRKSICGFFLQRSNRSAALRLRTPGGKIAIVTAYSPHSGYPFETRQKLFALRAVAVDPRPNV